MKRLRHIPPEAKSGHFHAPQGGPPWGLRSSIPPVERPACFLCRAGQLLGVNLVGAIDKRGHAGALAGAFGATPGRSRRQGPRLNLCVDLTGRERS